MDRSGDKKGQDALQAGTGTKIEFPDECGPNRWENYTTTACGTGKCTCTAWAFPVLRGTTAEAHYD